MRRKLLFALSALGLLAGFVAAYMFSLQRPALPPVFTPATSPYAMGIYADGIVESEQSNGKNINVYPEVAGTVKRIFAAEGQTIQEGMPLLLIEDSVQRAIVSQRLSEAQAAHTLLQQLKAEPRKETLDVADAQLKSAQARLKTAEDTLEKQKAAYEINPKSVSKDAFDNAMNSAAVAQANLQVAERQYYLTKAGAWSYDIRNQERQYNALNHSYLSSRALLSKYTLRAPTDSIILSINTAVGSYISPQGAYDTYTQGFVPVLVLGTPQSSLHVRCYIDEILVPRLPPPSRMKAQMSRRGSNMRVRLDYVRTQPYVSPKIELSNQRIERVDVRVLTIIFKVHKPQDSNLYPGELVDVHIGE
ncbi:MAG: efflux RND transporter periplasmic adaptor subunit [Acidobacteria bacterium]|nr:MAG: efflux RND transporter periplasmic adaptor subunit [Acidobacteriota bacterium]